MLSVVLLVACVAIAIGTILYLFFWNRLLGWILGVLVRLGLWTQDSSAIWVDFGSAHLSLISGRILLRDVRYHSCNQTVRIVKCQLSWRWWIRRVAEEEDLADGRSDGSEHAPRCRIHVSMEGFEWFMYNRTASFDNILSQLAAANPKLAGVRTKSRESNLHSVNHSIVHDEKLPRLNVTGRRALATFKLPSFVGKLSSWLRTQLPDLDPKNLLPLSFSIDKGAITLGNHTTENLLLGQFVSAAGTYGIVQPRSKLDDYKQMLRITFKDAGISFVENPDYWTGNIGIGKSVNETFTESKSITGVIMVPLNYSDFKKLWAHARKHFMFFKSRGRYYVKPDKERKRKGKKDSEEMSHVGADFSVLEYAIERKLLETPTLELLYYADVAGPVPSEPIGNLDRDSHGGLKNPKGIEFMDIGNVDLPPEWGVDVVVHGGSFRYGSWADRQRAQLQRVFFPQTFQAIEPSTMLLPRDQRTCTCLKLFFEFRGVTTLHIPFREPSKNWQWDGLADFPRTRKQREAASIQLRVGDNSSLKYIVPMIATVEGHIAELDIFMDDITVTSSLNDIRLLEAYSCSVKSLLPSPLQWNSERSWDFNVSLDKPTLYIIRDHVNMLTDLGKDWSTGPPHDFHTFVPIIYSLNLNLHDFELNLYANDHNIIDRPLDRRENVLFTLKGDVLRSITTVPSNKFRPLSTKASFSIVAPGVAATLTLPRWNTHGLVPSSVRQLTNFGRVGLFRLDGSYMYHAEVRDDCVDQLKLDIQIPSASLKLFGWIVRHAMVLRENYFGGFTQYSTTREYLGKREGGVAVGDPLDLKYRPGKSNVFHLDLSATARDVTVVLPAGVIGFERAQHDCSDDVDIGSCAVIAIRELQVQLRLHDFFMEMSFNVDPVVVSIVNSCPDRLLLSHVFKTPKEQLSISGLHITANRLFGPQPHTTTYVCVWSISMGDVKGFFSTTEAQILLAAGKSFGHGFVDPFNAPAAEYVVPAERDATFLKVAVSSVDLSWKNEPAVIRVDIKDSVQFAYNNIAGTRHRKLTTVAIPTIDIQMLLTPGTAKQWLEVGRFRTGVSFGLYSAPKGWREDAQMQKSFLRTQDSQTHRFATMMGLNSQFSPVRWSNTLYLQSIYAPRVSSSSRKAAVRVGIDASPPPARSPSRKDVVNSDSEDDYLISEADRDERLANSRPTRSTLPPDRLDAEQSSSAFDESDENGGSDSESSWSDYFELEDGADPRIPYFAFCRKLGLRHLSPEMDCRSEFVLGRENPVLQIGLFSDERLHTAKSSSDIDSKNSIPALPDDENRTYTCVDIQHSSAFLTPLCLTALKEILQQHNVEERGPELRLDELMLNRISSVAESSISVYNIRVRSLKLRVVHEIADLLKLHPIDEPLIPTQRAFAVSNVGIEELHGLISLPSSKCTTPGYATFGKLSVNRAFGSVGFLYTSSLPTKHDIQVPSVAVDFSIARFAAAFVKLRLQASYDSSELRICRSAPEVVLAAVNSLEHPLKELWSAETNHSSQVRLQKKQLVYTILAHSGNRMSTDLLSSVQPAFFVQKGRPQQLRSDDSWKLLFHLRHSLTSMSAQEYDELKRGLNTIATSTDMDTLVQTRQVPWAIEEGLPLIKVELIETLFANQTRLPDVTLDKHDNRPLKSMGFQAGSLCLVLDSGDSLARSSVTIQGVDFRADLLTRRMLFEPRTLSPQSSTIRSFRPTSEYVDYGSISLVTALDVDSLQITIFPSIIEMLQNALRTWRTRPRESDLQVTESEKGTPSSMSNSYIKEFFDNRVFVFDVRATLHHILVETAAENIVFEIASRGFSVGYVGHVTKPLEGSSFDLSLSHTGGFNKFEVKARTRTFEERGTNTLASITLASITVTKSLSVLLFQYHAPHGSTLRGTVHATSLELNVPRSAIRLYKFMEQWRQDYLLGLDTMLKSLFSEIKQGPDRFSKPSKVEKRRMGINLHASVKAASVVLQVMHGTWLAWTTNGVLGYFTEKSGEKGIIRSGGLQIESHSLRISSTSADWSSQRPTKIVLDLPSITGSGSFDTEGSSFLMALGFLTVTIKPSHWDSLLSVQQKFGQDFNDLILILGDARSKQPKSRREKPSSRRDTVPFYVTAKLAGFKIGMEGPSSTQFLECTDIDATVSHSGLPQWSVTLTDLALYLSPKSLAKEKLAHLDRGQLPVLVSIDLQAVSRGSPSQGQDRRLSLDITKLHAILQAHLMGDIGDFIDHLQGELMHRKENRAAELRGFKEKARNVMTTFNLYPRRSSIVTRQKFLDKSSIAISISNLGAAFPLDLTRRRTRKLGLDKEITTKALLLSIKSFKFETQRGESGEAVMEGFCFQFVSRFDPSNPEDFTAKRHHTLNQMLYPQMTARMRTETSSSTRRIYASAAVSGFILDLDSSITLYIFSLVDAYQHGRQRMEQLAAGLPRSGAEVSSPTRAQASSKGRARKSVVTSSIEADLRFQSGLVRMHCTSKDSSAFTSISPDWTGQTYQILDSDAELFRLPELTVLAEYHADVRQLGTSTEDGLRAPVLVFRSTVHSSRNSLRPLLLSFVSGVVHNVEERMKQASNIDFRPPSGIRQSLSTASVEDTIPGMNGLEDSLQSNFQLFISLRIDKSRLELTCRPDVNVIAGLNWESGGFILNMGPGAKGVSLSASIEGLTIGLKHGFLSDDSAHIDARNLIFSTNFAKKSSLSSGGHINSISVVVDTEFSGGIRFSRFQDFLCFKAVWLDNIPVFTGDGSEMATSPSRLSAVSSVDQAPKQGFDSAILIRVRHIKLDADLGQSISFVIFDLQNALIRARLTSECTELSISFDRVELQAKGNLSGHLRMPDFAFRTIRRRYSSVTEKQPLSRMLELNLTSGTLDVQLQSDWLWLLQYRAEPLEAHIYDDWSTDADSTEIRNRQLHLYFSVSGSKVMAMMTIMAIPKLLIYAGKLRSSLEAQREGASRESSAFRSTRLPRPDNALSEVANAMFRSARSKLKESESLSYVINQHMKLQLSELVFVVLPRSQGDNELARFIGRNVMAQLERTVQQIGLPGHRDLQLSLSHMSISQLLKQGFDPRLPGQEFDFLTTSGRNFSGTENLIFSLPAMDMRMITDEGINEGSRVLPYDFTSKFARQGDQRGENIHISFNIRLYSWLTILRKTFARELKRAQEAADWKTVNVSPASLTVPKLASPDSTTPPFTFGSPSDGSPSPAESRPPSRHSSRPPSPIRSRSVESVLLSTPSRSQGSQQLVVSPSPRFGISDTSKVTEQRLGVPSAQSPPTSGESSDKSPAQDSAAKKSQETIFVPRSREIERLTVKQLGEATPDVMHPFFTKKAGFNLEEALPQYVHEYATLPIEEIMKGLVKLYSKQLN